MVDTFSHDLSEKMTRRDKVFDDIVTYSMVGMVVDAFHLKDPVAMVGILENCAQIALAAAEAVQTALDEVV